MRNVARIKLGYYSLPPEEGKRLRKLLAFSAGTSSVVDPCVGTDAAFHQLTYGAEVLKHGVELDANRAAEARLDSSIPLLAENLTDLRVYRLTDPESKRFDQVALFGARRRMRGQDYSRDHTPLREMVWRRNMPTLHGDEAPIACRRRRLHGLSTAACLSTRLRTSSSTRLPGNKLKVSYSQRRRWQVVDRLLRCTRVMWAFSARPACSTSG